MADNQTTYKAVIDVDTKGTDQLEKLNKNLDETLEGFEDIGATIEKTRKALQKAKLDGDKVEFKRLRKELNNLERQLEDTEITSRRFSDALAEQPGVVGLVGQSLKGLDGGLKVLAANPIIAVVTLLAGLFITLKESLEKTERGQALLNKASEAFGKVLGPVFAIIEAVAFPIFEAFISYIEFVAEGFNKFAKFLGIGTQQIEEASRNSSEALQKAHDEEIARQEEQTRVEEEERQKRIAAAEEEARKKLEIQQQAAELLRQVELSLMDDRSRELLLREEKYQADLKLLKEAGITDTKLLEEQYYRDLMNIRQKFDNNQKVELTAKAKELQKIDLGIKAETGKGLIKIDEDTSKASTEIAEIDAQTKLLIVGNTLGQLAQAVGENTVAGKALAVAQATISTYQGAALALATYPPPFGAIAAATVIAAGLINVKKIISTKVPAPPGTNLQGSGGGSAPSAPSTSVTPPQIQGLAAGGGNTGTQIAQTIAESQQRPIRAYVVSQDISSQQAMDRRVNTAASL